MIDKNCEQRWRAQGSGEKPSAESGSIKQPAEKDFTNFMIAMVPGTPGGIAVFVDGVFGCRPLPTTEGERLGWLRTLKRSADLSDYQPLCLLERADPMRFKAAESYGFLLGAVQALEFRFKAVRPEEWQAVIRRHPAWGGRRPREFAHKLQQAVTMFFPDLKITPETSAALVILLWGMDQMVADEEIRGRRADGKAIAAVLGKPTFELFNG